MGRLEHAPQGIPGLHDGGWVQLPQAGDRTAETLIVPEKKRDQALSSNICGAGSSLHVCRMHTLYPCLCVNGCITSIRFTQKPRIILQRRCNTRMRHSIDVILKVQGS